MTALVPVRAAQAARPAGPRSGRWLSWVGPALFVLAHSGTVSAEALPEGGLEVVAHFPAS